MPKIYTENFLVSVHTMVTNKNTPKQILTFENLNELTEIIENYIRELPLKLNGIIVEIDAVDHDDENE